MLVVPRSARRAHSRCNKAPQDKEIRRIKILLAHRNQVADAAAAAVLHHDPEAVRAAVGAQVAHHIGVVALAQERDLLLDALQVLCVRVCKVRCVCRCLPVLPRSRLCSLGLPSCRRKDCRYTMYTQCC